MEQPQDITEMLRQWSGGDAQAAERLFALVYDELRHLARNYLRREQAGNTLQPTALVNEAYLRLIDRTRVDWQNRAHFYGIAAKVMRRILVEHARAHAADKRGGPAQQKFSLDETLLQPHQRAAELIALDEALEALAQVDERKSQVVELRFFGGLSVAETASFLQVSEKTVQRDWQIAKLWLHRELRADGGQDDE